MGFYKDVGKGAWWAARAISESSAQAAASSAQARSIRRARRLAATGVLGPGDPDPPPGGPLDFYDYRGVASQRELKGVQGEFGLGRAIDVRRGVRSGIGLPFAVLQRHAAVVGPTGSGKTTSILVPWTAAALRSGHSVVAVDIGGDFLDDLARYRQATGPLNAQVARWDFSDPTDSISWNWLADLPDASAISAAVEAIRGRVSPNDPQPFFHERDLRLLRAVIELSLASGKAVTTNDLLHLLRNDAHLTSLLASTQHHPAAQRIPDFTAHATAGRYEEMVSGVINALEIWDDPGLSAVTTRDQLRLEMVTTAPSLLVIGAPLHAGRTSEAASSLMISQMINRLYRRFSNSSGTHVFLIIDEAARLTDRIRYEELLSVSRRARVSVVLATQDVGQIKDESERTAIFGNCATYISLPGRSSSNARYLASRLGQRHTSSMTLTRDPGSARHGSPPASATSIALAPVLGNREIMDPPWGERTAIVHSPPLCGKPFLVDLFRSGV